MSSLTIFLLTHNRTQQALSAIRSILDQTSSDYKLIVSDNSDTNELELELGNYSNNLKYIKRFPVLSAMDHFNTCLAEIDTEYFSLFHDDDLMLNTYVSKFLEAKEKYPDALAFGLNAYVENGGVINGLSFKLGKDYLGPISYNELIAKYFSKYQIGISPFPSYVYHQKVAQSIQFANDAGKYGDVRFLMEIANLGKMIWVNFPVMIYRVHGDNWGTEESRRDRLRFLRFLKNFPGVDPVLLSDYRYFVYKKILSNRGAQEAAACKWYALSLRRFINYYKLRRVFRSDLYIQCLRRYLPW